MAYLNQKIRGILDKLDSSILTSLADDDKPLFSLTRTGMDINREEMEDLDNLAPLELAPFDASSFSVQTYKILKILDNEAGAIAKDGENQLHFLSDTDFKLALYGGFSSGNMYYKFVMGSIVPVKYILNENADSDIYNPYAFSKIEVLFKDLNGTAICNTEIGLIDFGVTDFKDFLKLVDCNVYLKVK